MPYDTTGLVTIEPAAGSAAGRAKAEAFLVPTPNQWSFGAVVEGVLDQLETAATIVIDTVNRKIYFTDDSDAKAALQTALDLEDNTSQVFEPTAGQTGKALEWNISAGNGGPIPDPVQTALTSMVAVVKPRKSAASLIGGILAAKDANGDAVEVPEAIMLDQTGKKIVAVSGSVDAALASAVSQMTAGNSGVLTLSSENPEDPEAPKLPFEGGEV